MSKIDLLTPDNVQGKIVCIRSIKNHPDIGYAYLSVLVDDRQLLLFFHYQPDYAEVMQKLAQISLPVHYVQFLNGKIVQSLYKVCPCTSDYWRQQSSKLDNSAPI